MAAVINRADPFRAYNFKIVIDGITEAAFQECSGLDSQTATVDYREGDQKTRHLRKIAGLRSVSAISLKRGITTDMRLWEWYQQADRRDIQIILLDETANYAEVVEWKLAAALPTKWVGPAFNATTTTLAIETLEIAVEELTRLK